MTHSFFCDAERRCVWQCLYTVGWFRLSLRSLIVLAFCHLYGDPYLAFATSAQPQSPSPAIQDTPLGSEDADAVSRALRDAIATEPKAHFSTSGVPSSVITQEIRYEMAEADEVNLGWGINGWKPVPEELRPSGTKLYNETMSTPMSHEGNAFVLKVKVPLGGVINYGFSISKTRRGARISLWDGNGYPGWGYQTIARPDHPVVVVGTLNLEKAQAEPNRTYAPLVTQEIRYQANGPWDVTLVWGINGWQTVSEDIRPSGTVIKKDRMHTPMVQKANNLIAKVRVPSGVTLDFAFLITRSQDGTETQIWDSADGFHRIVTLDGVLEIRAKSDSPKNDALQTGTSSNTLNNSTLARYWSVLILLAFCILLFITLRFRILKHTLSTLFLSILRAHRR